MQVAMKDGSNGYGVMGINIQPSFPTGVTMDPNFVAPEFCGSVGADKKNLSYFACNEAVAAEDQQSCCCTAKAGAFSKCTAWSCCKSGTKCKNNACA
jgi:hypothetical protein